MAIEHADRVRRGQQRATVVQVHKPSTGGAVKAYSVLPDDQPRSAGTVVWSAAETAKAGPPARDCVACGSLEHRIFTCPDRA